MTIRRMPAAQVLFDAFPLKGGLDLHTPQLSLPPGVARDAVNWECSINGGYSRIPGYERYDGRPSPTAALYTTLGVTNAAVNMLLRSQEFDNASWTKSGGSITANAIAAPDGTLTADKLVENSANTSHRVLQSFTAVSGTTYTMSIYAKAAERSVVYFNFSDSFFGTGSNVAFDLAAGTSITGPAVSQARMTALPGGWYRCSWTIIAIANAATSVEVLMATVATAAFTAPTTYLGDGVSGLYLWGAQLEDGEAPSTYVRTTTVVSGAVYVAGNVLTGSTSGATGTVVDIDPGVIAMSKTTGTFVNGEFLLSAGASAVAILDTVGVSVTDQTALATYQLAASDLYRADIAVVPGSGSILGGFVFGSNVYAFRNNALATAAVMYRASTSGWVAVTMPYEVGFTGGGATAPAEGATITKGAVSAVVRRVVVESGSFSGGTAAGRFIVDAPTGGAFTAGALTAGGTATLAATLSGGLVQAQVTMLPNGRFETDQGNAGNGVRVYGCDGVNRGWEFDGTTFVPIKTGMTLDAPQHVRVHKRHLFFSFFASAQHSSIANPYTWSPVTGAAEISVDGNITGFLVMPGDSSSAALAILSDDTISILYGTSVSTWNLIGQGGGSGAKSHSAQTLNQSYVFDDSGVVAIEAVQQYGNFATSAMTVNLRSFVQSRRTLVTDSLVNREKSQYRVYFSDGYGLYCTLVNGRFVGAMPVQFSNAVACAWAGASANGGEVSYFGSTNGMVYQLDIGTSFDGSAIAHQCELTFASQGNSRIRKRYRKAVFELQGEGYAEFSVGYTLAYGSEDIVNSTLAAPVNPVYWDEFTWDEFAWDGRAIAPNQLSLEGSAENISLRIEGSSALWSSFTVNSITLHYTPRRIIR